MSRWNGMLTSKRTIRVRFITAALLLAALAGGILLSGCSQANKKTVAAVLSMSRPGVGSDQPSNERAAVEKALEKSNRYRLVPDVVVKSALDELNIERRDYGSLDDAIRLAGRVNAREVFLVERVPGETTGRFVNLYRLDADSCRVLHLSKSVPDTSADAVLKMVGELTNQIMDTPVFSTPSLVEPLACGTVQHSYNVPQAARYEIHSPGVSPTMIGGSQALDDTIAHEQLMQGVDGDGVDTAKVLVGFAVDPEGNTRNVEVLNAYPTGHGFEMVASVALQSMHFIPGIIDSVAETIWMRRVVWFMREGEGYRARMDNLCTERSQLKGDSTSVNYVVAAPLWDKELPLSVYDVEQPPVPLGDDYTTLVRTNDALYPKKAARKKVGGTVLVRLIVGVNGVPDPVEVIYATPDGYGFGAAARKLAESWHFKPGEEGGQKVPVLMDRRIHFKM